MSNNVFASLGAIMSALQANNCKLVNFSETGEIVFETKQDGKIITAVLTNNNNSEESDFVVISENQSLIWKQNIEQQLNEAIKANYNITAEHSNYDAIAKRAIHAIGYDFNDEGELFKADNRPWHKKLLSNLDPKHPFFVTYIIMAINIAVFAAMAIYTLGGSVVTPNDKVMANWGASNIGYIAEGQYWRLFTCMFLHFGIFHIAFNMYALFSIGGHTEYFYKNKLYVAGYITCGLVASMVSLWFNGISLGAGASGAIFGVMGMLLGYTFTDMLPKAERQSLLKSLLVTVGLNIALTISSSFIDNSAHIGGLVTGIIISFFCRKAFKSNFDKNAVLLGIVGMLALLVVAAIIFLKPAVSTFNNYNGILKKVEISETNLNSFSNNIEKYTEYYETEMLSVIDTAINKFGAVGKIRGYKRETDYRIQSLNMYKKYQFFKIKSGNNKLDLPAADSAKYYLERMENGDY